MLQSSPLHAAVHGIANADTPAAAALSVLAVCCDLVGAADGRVHLLDLQQGRYAAYAPPGTKGTVAPRVGTLRVPSDPRVISLADFEAGELPPETSQNGRTGTVVLSYRGSSCIGAIALRGPQPESIAEPVRRELTGLADLLVPIYEDQFALTLLASFQEPLDFNRAENDFLRDLSLLVAVASGMEYVIVWELGEDALRCIAAWPLGDEDDDLRSWDIDEVSTVEPLAGVLSGRTVTFTGSRREMRLQLARRPELETMRSCVLTPIHVGTSMFGILAVGARCPFEYAPLERHGFESIASGIGVSIANFRSSHKILARVGQLTENAMAITAIELAQAARHEAAGLLDNCQSLLAGLDKKLGRHLPLIESDLDMISDELAAVMDALERFKSATRPPERTQERISLQELWEEARTAVAGRLVDLRIATYYTGPDVQVDASPDWLRQVFLNLLLNSIDAFRDAKKQGRRIELSVDRPSQRDNSYALTYRDNATGINPQRLRIPPEHADMPVAQVIFEPNVTSKRAGSGFGLWLVRKILDEHSASIDLRDHRAGVTFALRLPKPTDARVA